MIQKVRTSLIQSGAVVGNTLGPTSVSTNNIVVGAITSNLIASRAITGNLIANNAIVSNNSSVWINNYSNQISSITDLMTEDEFYADHITKEDVLDSLTQCLDYQPVKEISWTATLRVTGRGEVPLPANDNQWFLDEIEFSADAYNGNVIVEDTELIDIEEN